MVPYILHLISSTNTCIRLENNVNQEIDIGMLLLTRLQTLFTFLAFSHAFICVYLVLCHFITCIDSCNHDHNQDTEPFLRHKGTPLCDLIVFIPLPHLSSGNHRSPLHLYNFVIARKFYKWNHTACNLLRLTFSFSIILLSLVGVVAHSNGLLPSIAE